MIKNYFKLAFRNLIKNKVFSAINIFGLGLGLACSLLILLWVRDEKGIDAFHKNGDRLFYIYERNFLGNKIDSWYWTQGPLAEQLKKEIPEIEMAAQFSWSGPANFSVKDKVLKEDGYAAGSDFFSMFSHPLLQGNAAGSLKTPNSLSISRKMAKDFFGSPELAIGKTIRFENRKDFTVAAVFEDPSPAVSEKFNYIMSWSGYLEDNQWALDWASVDPRTSILLKKKADPAAVEKKIAHFVDRFNTELGKSGRIELGLQRFDQYYLHTELRNGYPAGGRIEYVQLFTIVAIFILIIACINFMNLTTANSVKRAREIGIRKVVGALRFPLILQFISEAVFLCLLSAVVALIVVALALPSFNHLTGKEITLPLTAASFWAGLAGLTLVTGLFAGSYPAFFLSAYEPIKVLKGALHSGPGAMRLRKSLVVFQFVLSIVLIIGTLMVSRQVNYVRNSKIGYDRENLIIVPIEGDLSKNLRVFRTEALHQPGIESLSMISDNPTVMNNGNLGMGWEGKDPNEHDRFIRDEIGPDYLKTMKLELLEGRPFTGDFLADSGSIIINETAARLTGYKDPVGKNMTNGNTPFRIIAVIKDFHFQSLHTQILPLVLQTGKDNWYSNIVVRTKAGQTKTALASLETIGKKLNPGFPFSYKFLDQEYANLYKTDEVVGRLSVLFAVLAIVISCLGLLGLSVFTASQRMRELGIRKVLGASVTSLFGLLSRDFLVLVVLAFAIAAPLGWWAMQHWLNNYAYHTNIPWWLFGVAGVAAILIALLTVSIQSLRAAIANPVASLKNE